MLALRGRGAKETFDALEDGVSVWLAANSVSVGVERALFRIVVVAKAGKDSKSSGEAIKKRGGKGCVRKF